MKTTMNATTKAIPAMNATTSGRRPHVLVVTVSASYCENMVGDVLVAALRGRGWDAKITGNIIYGTMPRAPQEPRP